jgi:phage/plasmid-like protein (TIGR03299 family)
VSGFRPDASIATEANLAHEIDSSTGKDAIAYVGDTPWHGLGEKLPEGKPIEVWVKAAQLDWDLMRLPVHYVVDGILRTMDDRFALVRSDTHTALSVVSGDYHIVQPMEVLEFYRDLVSSYGYTLETAGALDGGRKVWALARTGKTAVIDDRKERSDKVAAYVLLATSCDKTLATTAAFTSIRVVCQNTLFFAMGDIKTQKRPQVKVPHTVRFDAQRIKTELGAIDKAWTAFIADVTKMAAHPMQKEEVKSFFENILGAKEGKPLYGKALREFNTLMALFQNAPGQEFATAKGTLWGAVNAASYYVDHARPGVVGNRLNSAWFGTGCVLKDKAWAEASRLLA